MGTSKMSDSYVETSTYKNKSLPRKLGEAAFEGLGMFLFVFIIFMSGPNPAIFCFGFWVILTVFGPISGAHVNPAVTVGLYFTDGDWLFGLMKMGLYFVFQFIGAFAAVGLGYGVRASKDFRPEIVPKTASFGLNFFAEFFATGSFLFIIAIATHPKYPPSKLAPINTAVIIGWFYCVASIAGTISGGALNPAVLLAINGIAGSKPSMRYIPERILGEIVGAIFFAAVFRFIYSPFLVYCNEDKPEKAGSSEGFLEAKTKNAEEV